MSREDAIEIIAAYNALHYRWNNYLKYKPVWLRAYHWLLEQLHDFGLVKTRKGIIHRQEALLLKRYLDELEIHIGWMQTAFVACHYRDVAWFARSVAAVDRRKIENLMSITEAKIACEEEP